VETVEIRQGWLPGERLRERLRQTDAPAGTHYERTVKLGMGIERIEIQEATTSRVFQALWPLTEGCRIHKRRHRVREGDLVWEIDEFLDRPLWLAEVELTHADQEVAPPDWLAPFVERDVTDDPRYTNLKLAR
jgi:CYTH domain-containing protein